MCFLISDFLFSPDKKAIGKLNFRHELIPVRINDPGELDIAAAGRVYLQDPESGILMEANLNSPGLRAAHARALQTHRVEWTRIFAQLGIDMVDLLTTDNFTPSLRQLFSHRSRLFTH